MHETIKSMIREEIKTQKKLRNKKQLGEQSRKQSIKTLREAVGVSQTLPATHKEYPKIKSLIEKKTKSLRQSIREECDSNEPEYVDVNDDILDMLLSIIDSAKTMYINIGIETSIDEWIRESLMEACEIVQSVEEYVMDYLEEEQEEEDLDNENDYIGYDESDDEPDDEQEF
jgi:hypothetical protein